MRTRDELIKNINFFCKFFFDESRIRELQEKLKTQLGIRSALKSKTKEKNDPRAFSADELQAVKPLTKKYLNHCADNIIELQTFYFREPVNFYKYYYPLEAKRGSYRIKMKYPVKELTDYKFISLEGGAGYGKTTISKYGFLQTLKEHKKIPILINLRDLNEIDLKEYKTIASTEKIEFDASSGLAVKTVQSVNVISFLVKNTFLVNHEATDVESNAINKLLESGLFIIFFDGYDEVIFTNQNTVLNDIYSFWHDYKENNIIISSRPNRNIQSISSIKKFTVSKLTPIDVEKFILKIRGDNKASNAIIYALKDSKSKYYRELLSNPLLLSFFILTFEDYPEIPTKRRDLYYNVFLTLHSKHKARQGITKIPRRTNLSQSEYIYAMSAISYITYLNGEYEMTEYRLSQIILDNIKKYDKIKTPFDDEELYYDLVSSINILEQDGDKVFYLHRSIQEFFTAEFISSQDFDSKKKKAYLRLIEPEYLNKKTDDLTNLLDLLIEVDESGVKRYLILSILEEFGNFSLEHGETESLDFITSFDFYIDVINYHEYRSSITSEISIPGNKLITILKHFGYGLFYDNILEVLEIEALESEISFVLMNDPEVYHLIFSSSGNSNLKIDYRLIDFIKLSVEIENVVLEHFDRVNLKDSIYYLIKNEIKKIQLEIDGLSSGVDNIIDA